MLGRGLNVIVVNKHNEKQRKKKTIRRAPFSTLFLLFLENPTIYLKLNTYNDIIVVYRTIYIKEGFL